MHYAILLNKSEDTKQVEAQEQSRFIKSITEALGIELDWNPDEELTIEKKQELQSAFKKFNISIVDDADGGLKIYVERDMIAEWFKCKYKLKQDHSIIDRKKQLYLEMNINFWSVFEEENNQEEPQQSNI